MINKDKHKYYVALGCWLSEKSGDFVIVITTRLPDADNWSGRFPKKYPGIMDICNFLDRG